MTAAAWCVVGVAVWCAVAVVLGLWTGVVIRRRDRQTPS